MKFWMLPTVLLATLLLGLSTACAESPSASQPEARSIQEYNQSLDDGPHHRRWKVSQPFTGPDGKSGFQTKQYIEIQTGLNYQENGQWLPSQELIENLDFGAMKIGPGRAFYQGEDPSDASGKHQRSAVVAKRWQRMDGRDFLIEAVQDPSIILDYHASFPASRFIFYEGVTYSVQCHYKPRRR